MDRDFSFFSNGNDVFADQSCSTVINNFIFNFFKNKLNLFYSLTFRVSGGPSNRSNTNPIFSKLLLTAPLAQ